ncbi:MAG: hypothetical protein AAFX87_24940 [Bacteroidota bacterium]
MPAFDIALDTNFDLKIENGDFVIEETTEQHALLVLATAQGHWRRSPLLGARFVDSFHAPDPAAVSDRIKQQLEIDGMQVNRLNISRTGEIEIDGDY